MRNLAKLWRKKFLVRFHNHRRTGKFEPGGRGGGGKPFAQKILASCPNFYETVENERGSYDALT